MDIYHPYRDGHVVDPNRPIFYVIQHVPSGKYYAGYKRNSMSFMCERGYNTSSKLVKKLLSEDGFGSFIIRYVRYFSCGDKAHEHETRFLMKVDAVHNEKFLNKSNGASKFYCIGPRSLETRRKMSEANRRRGPKSEQCKLKISQALMGTTGTPHTSESRQKISEAHMGMKLSLESRQKISDYRKGHHCPIKNPRSDEYLEKQSRARKGRHWWTNGSQNKSCYESPGPEWRMGLTKTKNHRASGDAISTS